MGKYFLKKVLMMIPMLFVISLLVFIALDSTDMDPINYLIPPDVVVTDETMEALRARYNLDGNVVERYFGWLGNVLTLNFGTSIVLGSPVIEIIQTKLPATFELAIAALVISSVIGILIGAISAIYQNGIIDYIGRFIAVLGTSIPQFFFGIILLMIFAIQLEWLPVGGRTDPSVVNFFDRIHYMVLPVAAMSIGMVSTLLKYTRNSMLDTLSKDYIKTARSKGVPEWKVYLKHALRTSLRPVLVVLIFRLPILIGGSVVIESVFSYPGIGKEILTATTAGDYPVVMITTVLIAAAILLASVLVDLVTALLDPRVRFDK